MTQREIDFTRAEQLGLIERVPLAAQPRCRPAMQRLTLITIDSFGRGRTAWPSLATIASRLDVTERHARRLIRALEDSGLLAIQRRKIGNGPDRMTQNHYTIVWSELAVRCAQNDQPRQNAQREQPDQQVRVMWNNRTSGSEQPDQWVRSTGPIGPPNRTGSATEPPPTEAAWEAAAAEIRQELATAAELVRTARARGDEPQALVTRYREALRIVRLPANRRLLRDPRKALAWFLRHGSWPVDGITTEERPVTTANPAQHWSRREFDLRRIHKSNEASLVAALRSEGCPELYLAAHGLGANHETRETTPTT